ncbi:MAG: pilus assembly protein [Propionicimonas sp.]|uniref:pilus assembly protein n=1 Tax=Propionicimonas sp. TaxID=1955623 RepID=UPI003D14190A
MARTRRRHDEQGSISLWAVLIVATFTLIVGISVDLVGQIAAKQHATDIAAQAARIAGEQIDTAAVLGGASTVTANPTRARQAALAYIAGAHMSGTVTITAGGTQLAITTTASYQPVFLTSIGLGPLTVTGSSTARLVRTLKGSER